MEEIGILTMNAYKRLMSQILFVKPNSNKEDGNMDTHGPLSLLFYIIFQRRKERSNTNF